MNARAIVSLAFVTALALSCSRTHAPASESQAAAQSNGLEVVLAQTPLFERMQMATTTVRHGGTRRLQYHYEVAGVAHALTYEERVTADGHGRFALDPLRVGEPVMTTAQREVFDLLQKQREGFFFRFRDFGVRQRDLFFANYRIVDLHTNPVVAGRACMEIEVARITNATVRYRLAVDIETALVMRSVETAPDGREVARSEFIEFTLDPMVPADIQWFTPKYVGQPLDTTSLAAAGFTFPPIAPKFLPVGYQHLHSEIVREADDAWIRRVYSDGVENLFLLQKGLRGVSILDIDARGDSRGVSTSTSSSADSLSAEPYKIRIMTAGTWTLAEVSRGEEQIFVVGKIGEDEVLRVLKSSL